MPRTAQSQWDFGELFPPEQTRRRVLTVSELTNNIRKLLEAQIGLVWVTGEVTNLRAQSSGHVYFTIKDGNAQLQCVLFRSEDVAHRDLLQDGQKLVLNGDVTVYELRGQYQLIVRGIELQGLGALQLAFEKLKRKLEAEGLFATERKKAIPRHPQRIGLVTSETGAAIRDVLHVIERRQPSLQITLAACRVQGAGAAEEIAAAIRLLNEWSAEVDGSRRLDLILVTRGGGSLEDLWAFNEEVVARAIFDSALPIISAVGHEIDFTISDFVADLRAATPSAAAELITEGAFSSRTWLRETTAYLWQLTRRRLDAERAGVQRWQARLNRMHPRQRLRGQMQLVDDLYTAIQRCARQKLRDCSIHHDNLRRRLARVRPSLILTQLRQKLRDLSRCLRDPARQRTKDGRALLKSLRERLQLLSPENVLGRGYSITSDAATGKILRDAADTHAGQKIQTHLKKGILKSIISPD
ncbi:MAG: exodeoxyribonuclease VII large subunit [Verrucomicrobia subdivision 3 bacterium]|nr:exodeoxyribonuclease VII large subunit [Limisphaerales bacterium]